MSSGHFPIILQSQSSSIFCAKKNQFRDFYTISGFYAETWCRLFEPELRKFTLLFVAKKITPYKQMDLLL